MQPAFAECCGVALSLLHADLPQKGDKRHLRILPPLMKPVVSSAGVFLILSGFLRGIGKFFDRITVDVPEGTCYNPLKPIR
ncbi:MAG: hypothetical protein LUC21_00455 [Oscillospiraceae bacterium]|nr:hypothetical protein [Oscillospiraceae bacterium]